MSNRKIARAKHVHYTLIKRWQKICLDTAFNKKEPYVFSLVLKSARRLDNLLLVS